MTRPLITLLALVTLLGSGCGAAPPPTLYLLTAPGDGAPGVAVGEPVRPLAVALGPITVSDYLDRTDIVRRASDNRLAFDDNRRWAEPLRAGVQRVVAAELARRLGAGTWIGNGSSRGGPVDVEVAIDVDTYELNAAGQVVLSASWEIRPIGDERKPVRRHSHYQRTVPGNPQGGTDTEGQVAAMSAELGDLAADLAAALAPLAAPPSRKPPRDLPAETSNRS